MTELRLVFHFFLFVPEWKIREKFCLATTDVGRVSNKNSLAVKFQYLVLPRVGKFNER